MTNAQEAGGVREAVAVFDTAQTLQNAIDELLSSGFHRAELSLLASEADVVSKLGHKYRKSSELEDNPTVPRAAYVSTEAIGDGQGALIGALFYVGAGLLLGPVAAAGGTFVAMVGRSRLGRRSRRTGWNMAREASGRPARATSSGAARSRWVTALGTHLGRRRGESGGSNPQAPFRPGRPCSLIHGRFLAGAKRVRRVLADRIDDGDHGTIGVRR